MSMLAFPLHIRDNTHRAMQD